MYFGHSFQWLDIAYFDKSEVYACLIITVLDTWFDTFHNYNIQYQDNADRDLFFEKISNRIYTHLHDTNNDFLPIHYKTFSCELSLVEKLRIKHSLIILFYSWFKDDSSDKPLIRDKAIK